MGKAMVTLVAREDFSLHACLVGKNEVCFYDFCM